MKKLFCFALFCLISNVALAEVTCTAIKRSDIPEFLSEINKGVQDHLNNKCDTAKPYSVAPIMTYFKYGFGDSGATLPEATQVCCTPKA